MKIEAIIYSSIETSEDWEASVGGWGGGEQQRAGKIDWLTDEGEKKDGSE